MALMFASARDASLSAENACVAVSVDKLEVRRVRSGFIGSPITHQAGDNVVFAACFAVLAVCAGVALIALRRQKPTMTQLLNGAYRCVVCHTNWPRLLTARAETVFAPCPECSGRCDAVGISAISVDEAWSRKRHADFERFYMARELKQKQDAAELKKVTTAELDALPVEENIVPWTKRKK